MPAIIPVNSNKKWRAFATRCLCIERLRRAFGAFSADARTDVHTIISFVEDSVMSG